MAKLIHIYEFIIEKAISFFLCLYLTLNNNSHVEYY